MINVVPPAAIFILGAILIPLLKGRIKKVYLVLVPILTLIDIFKLKPGTGWVYSFLGYDLIFLHVDRLSLGFAYIFFTIGILSIIYSSYVKEDGQHIAAFIYMGCSLGVVFAGDFFTLFIFWEMMSVSVVLIWYQRDKESIAAGFRYILFHIIGGCALLAAIVIHYVSTGSMAVAPFDPGLAYVLLLIGIGVNAAFLPLHTWMPDAYPRATITGSVFLCVFTTKTAIYLLTRTFPGVEAVAYMGGVMSVFGVIFALLQNDVRRLLTYHIISQLGYMIAGIGIGTELAINGGIAHTFTNILFKTLLFMCMGAVIYRTGKNNLTELGGLAKKMPITTITCIIASLSISGAPGFNGFVSKGMVISSAAEVHRPILELMLTLAGIGTALSFIKLCYFTFFAKNEHIEAKEAPAMMQVAMCVTAFLCILTGMYPEALFVILPYHPVHFHAYSASHIVGVSQLLIFAGFVFMLAISIVSPHRGTVLDFDYFYRMGGRGLVWVCNVPLSNFRTRLQVLCSRAVDIMVRLSRNPILILEILTAYVYLRITQGLKYVSGYSTSEIYDENLYRRPIGVGVFATIILLFTLVLFYVTHVTS